MLQPTRLDISGEFARGFEGMTDTPVTIDELLKAREQWIAGVVGKMPLDHRKFLLRFRRGVEDSALLGVPDAEGFPPSDGGRRTWGRWIKKNGRLLSIGWARCCSQKPSRPR
jgi:hypothetical protein